MEEAAKQGMACLRTGLGVLRPRFLDSELPQGPQNPRYKLERSPTVTHSLSFLRIHGTSWNGHSQSPTVTHPRPGGREHKKIAAKLSPDDHNEVF